MRWARCWVMGALFSAIVAGCVGTAIIGSAAKATTEVCPGQPELSPEGRQIAGRFIGRFFATTVTRSAHVGAAELALGLEECEDGLSLGVIELRMYEGGVPTTTTLDLYPFSYVPAKRGLRAPIVPPGSVTTAEGEERRQLGELAVDETKAVTGTKARSGVPEAEELSGEIRLKGRAPFKITFKRAGSQETEYHHQPQDRGPTTLPKARQIGKR